MIFNTGYFNYVSFFIRLLLIVGLAVTIPDSLRAQQTSASVSLDTNAMLIGDHVGMTLKMSVPAGAGVFWPAIPDTILGNIAVIGRGKIDTLLTTDNKMMTLTQLFTLTCFDSGFYTIPPIPFRYRVPPDTSLLETMSPLSMLSVHTVAVDTTKAIKPIYGPVKVPVTFREILPWLLGGIAIILVIAATVWYLIRRKKNKPILTFIPKVVLQPHEKALQQLEMLKAKKLWQSGRFKEYHTELTDILRVYIEEKFKVPAMEQTTSEIVESLQDHTECPASPRSRLQSLLVQADLVKFAKAVPVATENEVSMTDALTFVRETSINAAMLSPETGTAGTNGEEARV